jgi:hypothetical protein
VVRKAAGKSREFSSDRSGRLLYSQHHQIGPQLPDVGRDRVISDLAAHRKRLRPETPPLSGTGGGFYDGRQSFCYASVPGLPAFSPGDRDCFSEQVAMLLLAMTRAQ